MLLDQPIQNGKPEAEQKEPASAQRLKQMRWRQNT
jgi:hypothetical protein